MCRIVDAIKDIKKRKKNYFATTLAFRYFSKHSAAVLLATLFTNI